MELILISLLAGVLTVFSPCILPLLPVVLAGSLAEKNWRTPLIIISSLAGSVIVFTLLIKASVVFIGIPGNTWLILSGILVTFIGITFAFPIVWEKISMLLGLQDKANRLSSVSNSKSGNTRNVLLGFSLGPVFTSCSPTYGLILATVLPTSFAVGFVNLIAYTLGLSVILMVIAYSGQRVIKRIGWASNPYGKFRRGLGVFLILVGSLIATGTIRQIEVWLVNSGLNISQFELILLN